MDAPADAAPFGFRFTCRRSGNCCSLPGGVVRVDPGAAKAIQEHLGMSATGFASRYLRAGGSQLRDRPDGGCVFLTEGPQTACSIYPVRPEQCRTWPFWEELRDPERLARAARRCPGIEIDTPSLPT